nr:helix-turn-helix domain-containing protein [Achromobacter insolitus]
MQINGVTHLPTETSHRLALFAKRLRRVREERRWSQVRLAKVADLELPTILSVERGDPTIPIGAYFAVLWALGLDADIDNLAAALVAPPSDPIDTNF